MNDQMDDWNEYLYKVYDELHNQYTLPIFKGKTVVGIIGLDFFSLRFLMRGKQRR